MPNRVVVFDDIPADQEDFRKLFVEHRWEVLGISEATGFGEQVTKFRPTLAIVDSKFTSDLDGLDIVKDLSRRFPAMPIIVCSVMVTDNPDRAYRIYGSLPGVKAVLPKKPFPTWERIQSLL